jgi:hypothetical protein
MEVSGVSAEKGAIVSRESFFDDGGGDEKWIRGRAIPALVFGGVF